MAMTTILHNATLIDGNGGDPVKDAVVVIDDNKITYAGAASGAPAADDKATRVDLGGNTICPGFIDVHVHFSLPGTKGIPAMAVLTSPEYRAMQLLERFKITLEAGVTTARDLMGVAPGVRDAIDHGLIPGPRLHVSSKMLSQTCGHADFHLKSGIDGGDVIGGELVDTVDQARTAARELIRDGVNVIKVASSGGVSTPNDDPDFLGARPEIIEALVQEGQDYGGIPVAAHAIGYPGIKAAVEAGVHSVEHGYALDDDLRKQMIENGQYLVPTLIETLKDDTATPMAVAKSQKWHKIAQDSVAESVKAGVKIATGTDAGLVPDHGDNLGELGCLVKFGGMSPLDAITAATKHGAEVLKIEDQVGTVEPGKLADIVVVKGNPLDDIDGLKDHDNILLVVKEGKSAIDRGDFGYPA